MNCAMPRAPAGETASGLKFDSARSCAARTAGETFHRDAALAIRSRNRDGTNEGRPLAAEAPSEARFADTASPAAEHGSGPRT
jgi:hypothetical protein